MRPNRLFGSDMVNVSLEIVTRRSAPAILLPALRNAARTESNSPNNKNAAITDSKVNSVRVLRLNRAAQTRWKYFMQAPLRARFRPLDQRALIEVQHMACVFGCLRIVRDHDDGLAVFAIELLQQPQD